MEWIINHGSEIWSVFASVVATASLVAKLTPSKWDDNIIAKIVGFLALNKK